MTAVRLGASRPPSASRGGGRRGQVSVRCPTWGGGSEAMGCTSAKQVSAVPSEDDAHDEYRAKGLEEVKYAGGEEERVKTRNQENLEKSSAANKKNQEAVGLNGTKTNIHTSESQQEFFRMLDEKIEKGRDYCSEEDDEVT
ncbi:hypothetical protein GN956_G24949 [Arapaima gigas]